MSTFFGFTDPFEDLLDMQRQMESLMNALGTTTGAAVPRLTTGATTTGGGDVGGRGLTTTGGGGGKRGWSPSLDVCETDKSLVVHAELPGCSKEDIKLSIDNNRLVLQGKKRAHKKEKGENWVRRERFRGSFYRSLPLPRNVEVENIQANYDNGILEIVVPKSQALAKRQTIDIKTGQGVRAAREPKETTMLPQRTEEEKPQEMRQTQEEQKREELKPEGLQQTQPMQEEQKREETKRAEEGVPQPPTPPQPPQLQQQEQEKFEQQPKQELFGQEIKVQPEQEQPLQQEEKQNIDIKFGQGEQKLEEKDLQAKLQQEGTTPSSGIFIQGGESGQVSQER